jgi:hypothetical protein
MTDDLAAARREWLAEDEAMRSWLPDEPRASAFVPAPQKSWWQRLVDWWRGR